MSKEFCTEARFKIWHTPFDGAKPRMMTITVVRNVAGMLEIRPEGYGEKTAVEGCGSPVLLEWRNNQLVARLFPDINSEEPVSLSLEGARESNRREEYE